jgi:4-amino-4-deoxy-L-arabinose transferase-like glycosyltransferase
MLLVLSFAVEVRELNALPMLLPLSLLAARATETLKRGAAAALDWFGIMTFGLMAIALWLGWIALVSGYPKSIAARLHVDQPGFSADINVAAITLSVVLTLLWIGLVSRIGRSNRRAVINWAGGITLIWLLITMLWMPYLDTGKSYRSVAISLKKALPTQPACIYRMALGRSQRAMFEYFAGVTTRRMDYSASSRCEYLLAQHTPPSKQGIGEEWDLIWQGARPGDKDELYALYKIKAGG